VVHDQRERHTVSILNYRIVLPFRIANRFNDSFISNQTAKTSAMRRRTKMRCRASVVGDAGYLRDTNVEGEGKGM
jgi:hypothetical protein